MRTTRRFRPRPKGSSAGSWIVLVAVAVVAAAAWTQWPRSKAPAPESKPREEASSPEDRVEAVNAAVLRREIARLRDDSARRRQADAEASRLEPGIPEGMSRLRVSDRVVCVDDIRLDSPDAADRLLALYRSIYAGRTLQVEVEREGSDKTVLVSFRKTPPRIEIVPPREERRPPEGDGPAVPESLRKRFLALPAYYRKGVLSLADCDRVNGILDRGGDLAWLTARVEELELLARREAEELDRIEIEASRAAAPSPEFDRRLKLASGVEALQDLAGWCRSSQFLPQERLCFVRILRIDPGFAAARLALGFVRDARTGWRREAETSNLPTKRKEETSAPRKEEKEKEEEPTVEFEGSRFTRSELRGHLVAKGYLEIGGKWHRKQDWEYVLDSLHSPGKFRWTGSGAAVQGSNDEGSGARSWGNEHLRDPHQEAHKARWVFLVPTAPKGSVRIEVDAPGILLECRLLLKAVLPEAGKGTLEVLVGGTSLYRIDSGAEEAERDITALVRGSRKVVIVANFTTTDTKMQYVRFLPSSPQSKRVFVLAGRVAVPEPRLDALLRK